MKRAPLRDAASKAQDTTQSPVKVCMHVLSSARTDVRVMRAATALVATGYAVTVVDMAYDRVQPAEEVLHGVQLQHVKTPNWYISRRFKPWFLLEAIWLLVRSTLRLLRSQADVYHAHDTTTLPACSIAAFVRHKPLIFDAHEIPLYGPSISSSGLADLFAKVLTFILPRCAGIITVSSPIAEDIQKRYHCRPVTLIRNVPPYQIVAPSNRLRHALALPQTVSVALYQGRLQEDRALDKLIRAAPFLAPDIVLALLGPADEGMLPYLEALIATEGVADRVKILPAVPYNELLSWSASADLGLIIFAPEYSLNVRMCLPNKLFEYLMAGIPILSSRLEAVEEVITIHDVGQIVSSLEPEAVATAINTMLADPSALARMRHNALTVSQQEFCWEKESQQLVHLYQTLPGLRQTVDADQSSPEDETYTARSLG